MEFNIGERVVHACGNIGTIVDKMYSQKDETHYYEVEFDDQSSENSCLYKAEDLKLVDEKEYTYEFDYLENVVVARLYEINDGEKTEISKGHGHILHDGVYGIAQAASYALKRILEDVGGGTIRKHIAG